jgi:hypothetical protein
VKVAAGAEVAERFESGRRFLTCGESESGVVLVQVENLHPLRTEWPPELTWPNVLKVAAGSDVAAGF